MDSGKSNSKLVHDFDLNIAYVEDFDINSEDQFSSPTHQASLTSIENAIANNVDKDNQLHQSSQVVDTAIQPNSAVETNQNASSVSITQAKISNYPHRRHRRSHGRNAESKQSTDDQDRFCTNFICKTRTTPMWRKGPLGPKTLCNACGLQYIKRVNGRGRGAVSYEDGPVPSETMEDDSNI